MTTDPEDKILKTEARWLEPLFTYNKSQFEVVGLPSHNHWHHYRVWCYMKELLETLYAQGIEYSEDELEGLIVATFFHDIAMHQTYDEQHGRMGADLCRFYFSDQPLKRPQCLLTVLEAIEIHDDKQYLHRFSAGEKPDLAVLLSVADDMDAFGTIGMLRYTEILLLRQLELSAIPDRVLKNARSRMEHLEKTFARSRYLVEKHRERYRRLFEFFKPLTGRNGKYASNWELLLRIRENLDHHTVGSQLSDLIVPADSILLKQIQEELEKEGEFCEDPGLISP
jgi:hypothetical protein